MTEKKQFAKLSIKERPIICIIHNCFLDVNQIGFIQKLFNIYVNFF